MMKLNKMSYYLLLFVMLMLYSSLTFAPWSYDRPPVRPINGPAEMTCPEWINYHGFTLDNYAENREMARTRTYTLDQDAYKWAAIYAYVIDEVETTNDQLLPIVFCSRVATINATYEYTPLKNEKRTCIRWITYYQFSLRDVGFNVFYANNRSPGKNYAISIWADSYSSYLISNKDGITPQEFCFKIGKFSADYENMLHHLFLDPGRRQHLAIEREIAGYKMSFMSEYSTNKTCQEWIELYGFFDNIALNYDRSIKLINEQSKNHIFIQYWPKEYSKFLKTAYFSNQIKNEDKKPNGYCTRILWNDDESLKYNFHYDSDDSESSD